MSLHGAFSITGFDEGQEWLVTNGIGGYAAGTVAGGRTRVYHGLLVAADSPPVGRSVRVPVIREVLRYRGRSYDLTTVEWADGAVAPDGQRFLNEFFLESGLPVWRFRVSDVLLERRLWMPYGRNEVRLQYSVITATEPVELCLTLFATHRDHHAITRGRPQLTSSTEDGSLRIDAEDPTDGQLWVRWDPADGADSSPYGVWTAADELFQGSRLGLESFRGLPDLEDLWVAGDSVVEIPVGHRRELAISVGASGNQENIRDEVADERRRRDGVLAQFQATLPQSTPVMPEIEQLVLAADQFIVDRRLPEGELGKTIIAGYPWFGDWGRDTMISLPGLTLATGRIEEARWILRTFARYVDAGMLPNLFPDGSSEPEYNTVDATLWYFEAIRAYLQATDDLGLAQELRPALRSIIQCHLAGTRYGIGVDSSDGLLRAGESGVQLTWMDARVGDWVVTPRIGKPVEINALWHHALTVMASLEQLPGGDSAAAADYLAAAGRAAQSFDRFVGSEGLLDVIDGPDGDDATIRPNQIFAISLAALRAGDPRVDDAPLLSTTDQAAVLEVVSRELLTPQGLRSLAPSDRSYQGWYGGSPGDRDSVYHQGPVWGWLIGPYVDAHLLVHDSPQRLLPLVESTIRTVLHQGCVGTVAEIYDGDAPHRERGAFAQAWSVAELLRAWRRVTERMLQS